MQIYTLWALKNRIIYPVRAGKRYSCSIIVSEAEKQMGPASAPLNRKALSHSPYICRQISDISLQMLKNPDDNLDNRVLWCDNHFLFLLILLIRLTVQLAIMLSL